MKIFFCKGTRIKASDTQLVYHFTLFILGTVFLLMMVPFHLSSIIETNWNTISIDCIIAKLQSPYFWASVITALFVCLGVAVLSY